MGGGRTFGPFVSAIPMAAAFCSLTCTMIAARVVAKRDAAAVTARSEGEARHISSQLRVGMFQETDSLQRVAAWWLLQGRPLTADDWENDAQLFVSAREGLETVAWMELAGKRSWSARPGTTPVIAGTTVPDPVLERTVAAAHRLNSPAWSGVFEANGKPRLYACIPIKKGRRLIGYIAGLYDAGELIRSLLKDQLPEQYAIAVTTDDHVFRVPAGSAAASQLPWMVRVPLFLPNAQWWVTVAATPDGASNFDRPVMSFGVLASVLIYVFAATSRISRQQAKALADANARLTFENRERRAAEEKVALLNRDLKLKLEEFETLLEVLPIGIAIADDPACRKIWTNRALAGMLNLEVGQRLFQRGPDFELPPHKLLRDGIEVPPEDLPMQLAARTRSVISNYPLDLARPDGTVLHTLSYAAPLFDEAGKVRGVIDACVDITERKALEERVQRAEKYQSLALMAGGIAHDFNNLLTVIIGYTESLAMEFPKVSSGGRAVAELQIAAHHAAELVAQLLAFTGQFWWEARTVSLSAEIEQRKASTAALVPPGAAIRYELAAELPPMQVGLVELTQVIHHLVSNAAESLGPDNPGAIEIRTSSCQLASSDIEIFYPDQALAPGMYIRLEVTDNGCGIPDEVLPRIFDPFFTTKFVGRGLGLSAVQGIVRAHRGGIRVESSLHHGTRIEIVFPVVAPEGPMRRPALSVSV